MVKRIFKSFIVAGFVLLSIPSTWALSAFSFEAACVARSALRLAALAVRPLGACAVSTHAVPTYAVATYDDAFKEIIMNEVARNSLFKSVINEDIISSEPMKLSAHTKKEQAQVTADSIGDFLESYKPVMERFKESNPGGQSKHKKTVLSLETFAEEIAYKYFDALSNLFPPRGKKSYMDFSCRLANGDIVLVETQVRPQDYWNQRALAYAARAYSNQLMEGQSWENLKKVYSINILGGIEFTKLGKPDRYTWEKKIEQLADKTLPFMRRYEMINTINHKEKIPHLQIIQLLPQLYNPKETSLELNKELHPTESLKEWLELFKEAQEKDPEYVKGVKDPGVRQAYDILARHEPSDQYKQWKETFGPKVAEQLVQSKAEGLAEGISGATLKIAQNLLKSGISIEVVESTTNLSREQIETLLKDISAEKPPLA